MPSTKNTQNRRQEDDSGFFSRSWSIRQLRKDGLLYNLELDYR